MDPEPLTMPYLLPTMLGQTHRGEPLHAELVIIIIIITLFEGHPDKLIHPIK